MPKEQPARNKASTRQSALTSGVIIINFVPLRFTGNLIGDN
jgi:hypothetical protein